MSVAKTARNLVADIGGTNTRVAMAEGRRILPDTIRRYSNAEYPGLDAVLRRYIEEEGDAACGGACVAAAGPVRDGVAQMTNLDWVIDGDHLAQATGASRVAILNDLQAQGFALGHIAADRLRPMLTGSAPQRADSTQLVIGVGTGFNAAPVHEAPGGRIVVASECGHANLPIRTESDLRLLHFVETVHGFPGVEDVLSGRGLERVFAWLCAEAGQPRDMPAAEIMRHVADRSDETAVEAGRVFVRMLGTVAGNLALIHLPFGGVHLIGGVARAFTPYLAEFGFGEAFRDKGRFSGFMHNFAVTVIEDDYAALIGCAAHLDALSG